jgi:hypothetical protein
MMWDSVKLPSFSGGTIVRHSGSTEKFYCRVLAGSWDGSTPECIQLGPYDMYEKAQLALIEYGSRLLERDKFVLEERKKFVYNHLFETNHQAMINEAREDGIAQGMRLSQVQIAETMKAAGFSVEDIAKATNLTEKDIRCYL